MGPLANEVVGSITADITKNATGSGESALGDLFADAQLYATSCNESAVVAFMTPAESAPTSSSTKPREMSCLAK